VSFCVHYVEKELVSTPNYLLSMKYKVWWDEYSKKDAKDLKKSQTGGNGD
jgi:hypothetical protein